MSKILLIEDENHISELIKFNLETVNHEVFCAYDGKRGIEMLREVQPDLVVLDLMLPEIDGIQVCRHIREKEEYKEIPVIMLTAKSSEDDKITGLEIGADDYITKPFSVRELLARVKVQLRRSEKQETEVIKNLITLEGIIIDSDTYEVRRDDSVYSLTHKEFELLKYLAQNQGKVLSRDTLLDKIWGYDYIGESRTVDVHIRHIRSKIEDEKYDKLIETVRGVGYKIRR